MHDIAIRLAGRGVSDEQIRDDTKDRDVHRLQPLLHRRRHVAERQMRRNEDPPLYIRTEALSIFKPTQDNGIAWSQSPDPGEHEAEAVLYQLGQ